MGRDNLAFETVLDQFRKAADMIDMGMGDENEIDLRWFDRPGVHPNGLVFPLHCPAIHKHVEPVGPQKMG
jgi:hypothetical protein